MASDGMLLNFAVDDTFTGVPAKFKGGSWQDRARLKKRAQGRVRPGESGPRLDPRQQLNRRLGRKTSHGADSEAREDFPVHRPAKRVRQDGDFVPASSQPARDGKRENRHRQGQPPSAAKSGEVISSLFSYNPKPSTAAEQRVETADETPSKPSNAPLVDGMDTFTSLGLSPTLAAHLLTKMELKSPTAIQKASMEQLLKEDSDAFIQSETGSGKTLAYLLPVVQRIMALKKSDLHRDSGLFAIILAPTRELCKQITVVLEKLLGCAHYIVASHVIGGEKKKSEKARLRKGLNVLVATPGRLVDHLQNTKVLDVSHVRWLVLDEGDRLMDLGFEEDIATIVNLLDSRWKQNVPGLPARRTTILCSATMKMNVQKLGEISLKDAVLVKGESRNGDDDEAPPGQRDEAFLAPAQLKQSYVVCAAKLRLVTLVALLKRTFARKGSVMKAIVFVSCADSVEFHFKALTRPQDEKDAKVASESESATPEAKGASKPGPEDDSVAFSPLLSASANPLTVFKLHGSLPQASRTSIVKSFATSTTPSLLIATDVASRGLDLPNLDLVIEFDPAFSADDHLHRIGRTARLGRDGRAVVFLLPGKEEGYVDVLKQSYRTPAEGVAGNVTSTSADEILKRGFAPAHGLHASGPGSQSKDWHWEAQATECQLQLERWVLADAPNAELARKAFQSHVRAYATHVGHERKWFDIKELHLGHLAKAFGLREAPARMNQVGMGRSGAKGDGRKRQVGGNSRGPGEGHERAREGEVEEAARKMREKVRNRKMMMGAGAGEFNIA